MVQWTTQLSFLVANCIGAIELWEDSSSWRCLDPRTNPHLNLPFLSLCLLSVCSMCYEWVSELSVSVARSQQKALLCVYWLEGEIVYVGGERTICTRTFASLKGKEVTLLTPADPGQHSKPQTDVLNCFYALLPTFMVNSHLHFSSLRLFPNRGLLSASEFSQHALTYAGVWRMKST